MSTRPCTFTREEILSISEAFGSLGGGAKEQAIKDLFALGCYIRISGIEGGKEAGWKACHTAIDALHLGDSGLTRKILESLDGNERSLGLLFGAHSEIERLFLSEDKLQ